MADLPTADQAAKLKDGGFLSDDIYNRLYTPAAPSPEIDPNMPIVGSTDNQNAIPPGLQERIDFDMQHGIPEEGIRNKYAPELTQLNNPPLTSAPNMTPATYKPFGSDQVAGEGQLATDNMSTQKPEMGAQDQANAFMNLMKPDQTGFNSQIAAENDMARIGQLKGAEEAAKIGAIQDADKKRIDQGIINQNLRNQEIDKKSMELEKASNDLAAMKVDNDRYWKNKTTGDKITAGIGMFLGAFGQGGNKGAAVIQNAINQDIESQKSDINTAKDALGVKKGLYADMVRRFGDQDVAEAAARSAYLGNTMLGIQQTAAKYSGPEAKAKAQLAIGQIQQAKDASDNQFRTLVAQRIPAILNPNDPNAMKPEDRERYVPGYGLALTKEDAKNMKENVLPSLTGAKDNINTLLQIADMPNKSIDPSIRARAGTTAAALKASLRTPLVGPGAVSESEWALLDSIIANPTNITSLDSTNKVRLQTLMGIVNSQLNKQAQSAGLKTPDQKIGFVAAKR